LKSLRQNLQAQREARREASEIAWQRQQQIKRQASNAKLVDRMQQFLKSGDPILMAEAMAWAEINPGVLDVSSHSLRDTPQDSTQLDDERRGSGDDMR
jgi:hypothetical protein